MRQTFGFSHRESAKPNLQEQIKLAALFPSRSDTTLQSKELATE
jgi:hypothetical protein